MIIEKEGFILLTLQVVPRSSRSEIVGEHNGALKVRLASPPVDGAANVEAVKLLAKALGVARSAVTTTRTGDIPIVGFAFTDTFGFFSAKAPVDNATAIVSGSARSFMEPL